MKRLKRAWSWLMDKVKLLSELQPAMFRGAVVAVIAALASVGVQVAPGVPDVIVNVLTGVVTVSALISALWTRPAVTPNSKVIVYAPDPIGSPRAVEPGEYVTRAPDAAILDAARSTPVDTP